MYLHEYQTKKLFAEVGVSVPPGVVAESPQAVREAIAQLGGREWMLKAQVHSGGRGQAGGVVRIRSVEEGVKKAGELLGSRLVTAQSGPEGLPVSRILIESVSVFKAALYLSLLVDRVSHRVMVVASAAGGMDIEDVAQREPERILREIVQPAVGLQAWQARRLGFDLGLPVGVMSSFSRLLLRLYDLLIQKDASLVEINPLVVTQDDCFLALDAKLNIDDNALYRQRDLADLRDTSQVDMREMLAIENGLNYIPLDGEIACMVNGAGLAMATMDLIQICGGRPANFLDVGGGTTAQRVAEAFKLLLSDAKVRAVLVNIFGGIVRCDLIAEGILKALHDVDMRVPLIVRLEGTRSKEGLAMLREANVGIEAIEDLTAAAQRAVERAGEKQ